MEYFSKNICKKLGYYVYRLVDPRNGQTFYVGKGKNNRVFAHIKESLINFNGESYLEEDEDETSAKIQQIREIKQAGLNVIIFVHRWGLQENEAFECKYNKSGFCNVKIEGRNDLKMSFLTAHKSKGLQADYVFIINNKNSRMGFPSKIQDAPVLNLLLEDCDKYPYAEERRLFYVALTRAKEKAYIVTVDGKESEFVYDLRSQCGGLLKQEKNGCPLCDGYLIKIHGVYGDFWGCSNYRDKGCKFKKKIYDEDYEFMM